MSGLLGGVDMPQGMSAEDRKGLLEYENTLAAERDAEARKFQREQDRLRQAQEREVRNIEQQQEQARIEQLEEQERAAAGVAESPVEAVQDDREARLSQMWGSLASGQDVASRDIEEQRPE